MCVPLASQGRSRAVHLEASAASQLLSLPLSLFPSRTVQRAVDRSVAMTEVFVVGDVGGTNTRLVLYEWDMTTDKEVKLAEKIYPSKKYNTLTDAVKEFLNTFSKDRAPTSCCLALAGPVVDNTCVITNLNWHIRGSDLSNQLRIPHVSLINDFVAAGYGCLALPASSLTPLYTPPAKHQPPPQHAVKAIIGAGTGLGEAFAVWDEGVKAYKVYPTEGGHADFGPQTEEQCKVMLSIQQRLKLGHVSVERLVSGSGIPNIYHGLHSLYPQQANSDIAAQLASPSVDAAAVISQHAATDPLCRRTIQLFTTLYGAETGNLTLRTLALGGVYIAGGVAGKMLPAMRAGDFQKAFVDKGRLGAVVETVPVWLAKGEVGLDGARVVAKRLITEHKHSHRGIALLTSKL